MGVATNDSKHAVEILKNSKKMVPGLCDDLPKREFKTLKAPVHPRQREMDAYKAIPSQYSKTDVS